MSSDTKSTFLYLLVAVVAWLAQALQVPCVPEHGLIASMRLDVVSDELRRHCFDAMAPTAGEQVTL